jgi:hypothetical protein
MNTDRLPLLVLVLALSSAALTSVAGEAGGEASPITPTDSVIRLFNGRDLDGLYTWLGNTKYEDPFKVFTVQDGMLRISGEGFGGITTKNVYRDYHLVSEFRWGTRTWAHRKDRAKDSGVLFHANGPDGAIANWWMESFEANIIEGGVGDVIIVKGPGKPKMPMRLTAELGRDRDDELVWKKGAPRETIPEGRVNWFGRDPDWKDVLGFRGKHDVERPGNAWNRMDVICDGGYIAIKVNGILVNEAFDLFPSAGKIMIQSEGAEIFIRRWELWPLGEAPRHP